VASENFVWGVGEHTDYGFLTILLQDSQEGLEIQNIHGEWIAAPSIEGTLVVNIGDMLEICTGGFYRSTPHRVRNRTGKSRLSFPFFYDPGFLSKVESIPEHAKEFIKEYSEKFPIQRSVESSRRWDQQDLASFEGIIYGKYLLGKVSKVFPNLASENLNDYFLQQ
jgi:isopenicillin N synthase-like dioxygenase